MAQMPGDNPWLCWPPRKWRDASDVGCHAKGVSLDAWRNWLMHIAPESARREKKKAVECNQEPIATPAARKGQKGASDEPLPESRKLFG